MADHNKTPRRVVLDDPETQKALAKLIAQMDAMQVPGEPDKLRRLVVRLRWLEKDCDAAINNSKVDTMTVRDVIKWDDTQDEIDRRLDAKTSAIIEAAAREELPVGAQPDRMNPKHLRLVRMIVRGDCAKRAADAVEYALSREAPPRGAMTTAELADRLDCSDRTIARYANAANIKRPPRGARGYKYPPGDCLRILDAILSEDSGAPTELRATAREAKSEIKPK